MARPLVIVAMGGLAISAVCLSLATSLSTDQPSFFAVPHGGHFGWGTFFGERCLSDPKEAFTATSREIAWDGDDSVAIDIAADVHYAPGPSRSVTVRGAPEMLRHVQVRDGVIEFDCYWRSRDGGVLDVTLPGIAMRSFTINGTGHLSLDHIKQQELRIAIYGSGNVRGSGEAERLDLTIAGSGDADLGQLSAKRVRTAIAGSGEADIAPLERADLVIAGSGDVRLHSQPKQLRSKVVGSGRVIASADLAI